MNYNPKFIEGMSIDQLEAEIKEMYERQFVYGASIDRPRLWDIQYTIRELRKEAQQ